MIKRKERAPLNDLDVGPFSDISFLLIIFFILTTQIISMSGIVLSIPAGAPKEEMQEMEEDKQQMLIQGFSDSELKEVVDELYVDDAADLVGEMPANVVKRIKKTIYTEHLFTFFANFMPPAVANIEQNIIIVAQTALRNSSLLNL